MSKKPETVSIAEAAVQHGKCVETIYRLVRSGRIPAAKDGNGDWRIERQPLADYYVKRAAGAGG